MGKEGREKEIKIIGEERGEKRGEGNIKREEKGEKRVPVYVWEMGKERRGGRSRRERRRWNKDKNEEWEG